MYIYIWWKIWNIKREKGGRERLDKIFQKKLSIHALHIHILSMSIQYWLKHQLILVSDYSQFFHFIAINIHLQKIEITDAAMARTFTTYVKKFVFIGISLQYIFCSQQRRIKNSFTRNCRENFSRGTCERWYNIVKGWLLTDCIMEFSPVWHKNIKNRNNCNLTSSLKFEEKYPENNISIYLVYVLFLTLNIILNKIIFLRELYLHKISVCSLSLIIKDFFM